MASPVTVYAITGESAVESQDHTYANARVGSAMGLGGALTYMYSGQIYPGDTWYYVDEGLLNFDTGAAIEDNATVTVVVCSVYVSIAPDESHTQQIRSYNWGDPISTGDWVSGDSLAALTLLASKAVTSASSGYLAFTSQSAFPAAVNLTGYTRVIFNSDLQIAGTAPTGNARVRWYDSDYTGTTRDPKIVATYTLPSASFLPGIMDTEVIGYGGLTFG